MEGYLLVPSEFRTLIGRPGWKPRFITFSLVQQRQPTPPRQSSTLPRRTSSSKLQRAAARQTLSITSASTFPNSSVDTLDVKDAEAQLWLSVFKARGDTEPISQHIVSSITSCEIASLRLKKSEAEIPTLVVTFLPPATTSKASKRRSSRAGTLHSTSGPYPNSLLFRSIEQERWNIYDWQICIQPRIQPRSPGFDISTDDVSALSGSPLSNNGTFRNPFCPKQAIAAAVKRPEMYNRYSRNTSYEPSRPITGAMISPSPSLRSRRSDLSSQSSYLSRLQNSSHSHNHLPIQTQYTSNNPELPSPTSAHTIEFGPDALISGWTNAQGRSSSLSHHNSSHHLPHRASISASVPEGKIEAPRETILDRAFMLKQIPGSERMGGVEEEEDGALSSIARFEKLMKEQEEKKRAFARASARPGEVRSRQQPPQAQARQPSRGGRKNWGVPDAGEESDIDPALPNSRAARRSQQATPVPANPNANFYIDSNDSTDDLHLQHITAIPPPAQRALEFISGRTTPTHPSPGHPSRPTSRSISQANLGPRPPPPPMPRMASTGHASKGRPSPVNYSLPPGVQREGLKPSTSETHLSAAIATRRTSSNSHRLSFTEFTKRLSSEASSLLLVQTNTSGHSGGSKRNSHVSVLSSEGSIYEGEEETDMRRGTRLSVSGASGQAWKGYNMNAIQTQMSQVQLSNTQPQRPGMGARRSTVATEGRESWRDSSAKCGSGWRGNGVNFGDGGFL